MGAVALDPANPSIVYAGTGGPQGNALVGLYGSTSGGSSWTALNPNSIFTGVTINRIVLPSSGTLLVATSEGLYKSTDGGNNFGNNPPAFNNAQPISISIPGGSLSSGFISDLKLDTATRSTVYVAVSGQGIFKSIDAGTTFTPSGMMLTSAYFTSSISNISYVTFAQSTQPNNQTFYATVEVTKGTFVGQPCTKDMNANGIPPLAMFKSTDGGATWPTRITLGPEVVEQLQSGFYDQTIGVDPQDSNSVYMGMRALYLSSDGGKSGFRDLIQAQGKGCPDVGNQDNRIDYNKAHVDQHVIAFSPASHFTGPPTRVFTGNDGGFASTAAEGSPPGSTWQLLNNGLSTILLKDMDIGRGSSANNSYSYGAAQDNGISVGTRIKSGGVVGTGMQWL